LESIPRLFFKPMSPRRHTPRRPSLLLPNPTNCQLRSDWGFFPGKAGARPVQGRSLRGVAPGLQRVWSGFGSNEPAPEPGRRFETGPERAGGAAANFTEIGPFRNSWR
jgi:hypothetical protein